MDGVVSAMLTVARSAQLEFPTRSLALELLVTLTETAPALARRCAGLTEVGARRGRDESYGEACPCPLASGLWPLACAAMTFLLRAVRACAMGWCRWQWNHLHNQHQP